MHIHVGHTYWSKDIIILVTDDGVAGTQAWLDAYHGEQGEFEHSDGVTNVRRCGV